MTRGCWQRATLVVALAIVVPASAGGQSLGEIARKGVERRGDTPTGKVYTNENLTPDEHTPPRVPARTPAEMEAARAAEAATPTPEETEEPAADDVTPPSEQAPQRQDEQGEEYWRGRAAAIRSRQQEQQVLIEALQGQMASLAPRDPERDVVSRAIRQANSVLGSVNDEWVDLERLARSLDVPAAWLR